MKTLTALLVLAAPLALGACRSTDPAPKDVDLSSVPCICGTPEGAFDGCAHPTCVQGENNPDNPNCVCSQLTIGEVN